MGRTLTQGLISRTAYKGRNMRTLTRFAAAAVLVLAGIPAHAQQGGKLSTQDYIDIQQLAARYAFLIDTCTNGGNDFADLFTPDGEFSVSQQWGVANGRKTKGHEALAAAAGGDGKGGCVDPKT